MWTLDRRADLPAWRFGPTPAGVLLAFSTRRGGVSDGPYRSLNLGRSTDDRPEAVDENRRRWLTSLAIDPARFANAGQVCISTQRVLTAGKVYGEFLDALTPKVAALTMGSQLDEKTKVGPMIREKDAVRVDAWIREAVEQGARVVVGGQRQGAIYSPTVVADVKPEMRISCDELFGPAVAVTPFDDLDQAIALANDTQYGLAAGIFTENLEWAWKFAREVHSGNLHVNWGPQWRADLMPYGGVKDSGFGKEGPAYAVLEMTELKMVVFHLSS